MNPALAVTRIFLALMGWQLHDFEGTAVWTHISGVVVYNQGVCPC